MENNDHITQKSTRTVIRNYQAMFEEHLPEICTAVIDMLNHLDQHNDVEIKDIYETKIIRKI